MPNFLPCEDVIHRIAEGFAARVFTGRGKEWLRNRIPRWLRRRPDCAVRITFAERDLPPWATDALQAGREVHRFHISQDALEIINHCVAYIQSLERAHRKQNKTIEIRREAEARLDDLTNQSPEQVDAAKEDWDGFKASHHRQRNPSETAIIPAQDDDEPVVKSIQGRHWERLRTLAECHETGTALSNCLRRSVDYYRTEFIDGDFAFWRLVDRHNNILALMRIDVNSKQAVEFKGRNNARAWGYARDAEKLLNRLRYDVPEDAADFQGVGIDPFGFGVFDPNRPHYRIDNVKIWRCESWVVLEDPRGRLHINLSEDCSLEGLWPTSDDNGVWPHVDPDAGDLSWLGRLIAELLNRSDSQEDLDLVDLVKTRAGGWTYWRDAVAADRVFEGIRFFKTEKGIAILPEGEMTPMWILTEYNVNAGRRGAGVYVFRLDSDDPRTAQTIEAIEASANALAFWQWVDPIHNKGPSYADLCRLMDSPYSSHLQPDGWHSGGQGWTNREVPNLAQGYSVKERWIFDEQGCERLIVQGTQQRRAYAKQVAVFRGGKPKMSCLITSKRTQQGGTMKTFKMLTDDFSCPTVTAALFSAIWQEVDKNYEKSQIEKYVASDPRISRTIFREKTNRPNYFAPTLDVNSLRGQVHAIREDEKETLYGVSLEGTLLWSAVVQQGVIVEPAIYEPMKAEHAAMEYACNSGYRISDEWEPIALAAGYIYLPAEETARRILASHLNKLWFIDEDGHGALAKRTLEQDEFAWLISEGSLDDEEPDDFEEKWELRLAPQGADLLIVRAEGNDDRESSPSAASRILIHAVLDSCGKTLSAIQLGILGLARNPEGGHSHMPSANRPSLSRTSFDFGTGNQWVRRGLTWRLQHGETVIATVDSAANSLSAIIHVDIDKFPSNASNDVGGFATVVQESAAEPHRPVWLTQSQAEDAFGDVKFSSETPDEVADVEPRASRRGPLRRPAAHL